MTANESIGLWQATLQQERQMWQTLVTEQVDQIVFRNVSGEINYYFLLVWTHQLVFELAKNFQKFEEERLLARVQRCLLSTDDDLSQNFGDIQS
jgi:Fe2+ transport system protein B